MEIPIHVHSHLSQRKLSAHAYSHAPYSAATLVGCLLYSIPTLQLNAAVLLA
jgi:hypothetical protein